jgi:hypothetical protein
MAIWRGKCVIRPPEGSCRTTGVREGSCREEADRAALLKRAGARRVPALRAPREAGLVAARAGRIDFFFDGAFGMTILSSYSVSGPGARTN